MQRLSLFNVIAIHQHPGNPTHHYINASLSSWSPSKRFCMPARAVPPNFGLFHKSVSVSKPRLDWLSQAASYHVNLHRCLGDRHKVLPQIFKVTGWSRSGWGGRTSQPWRPSGWVGGWSFTKPTEYPHSTCFSSSAMLWLHRESATNSHPPTLPISFHLAWKQKA